MNLLCIRAQNTHGKIKKKSSIFFALFDAKTELLEIELNSFDIIKYFFKYFPTLLVSFIYFEKKENDFSGRKISSNFGVKILLLKLVKIYVLLLEIRNC